MLRKRTSVIHSKQGFPKVTVVSFSRGSLLRSFACLSILRVCIWQQQTLKSHILLPPLIVLQIFLLTTAPSLFVSPPTRNSISSCPGPLQFSHSLLFRLGAPAKSPSCPSTPRSWSVGSWSLVSAFKDTGSPSCVGFSWANSFKDFLFDVPPPEEGCAEV